MFGHNDQQHHDDGIQPAPAADGALSNDDQQQVVSAPPMDGDAGDFIDDVPAPAATPAVTLPNIGAPAVTQAAPVSGAADAVEPTTPVNTDQLLDIKQQALQQLTPLVGHLEQSPEEKFRTTMMMIQAADNHALIQNAYEAAQQITDEKARAQALLDIVNEINYFTHNDSTQATV